MKIRNEGSILIITLWVMLILSLLAASLSFRGGLEAKTAGVFHERFLHRHQLQEAIGVGIHFLANDSFQSVDTLEDTWYNPAALEEYLESLGLPLITLEIQDEESKLNINFADNKILTEFLSLLPSEGVELPGKAEDLAGEILAYRGDSTIQGGEAFGKDYKKAPFEFLEEIRLLEDLRPLDVSLISSWISIWPKKTNQLRVNINTAKAPVLKALINGAAADDRTKADLLEAILQFRENEDEDRRTSFGRNDLSAYQFLDLLGIIRDVKMVSLAVQVLRNTTVNSEYFTITAVHQEDALKITAVVGPPEESAGGTTSSNFTILNWREM